MVMGIPVLLQRFLNYPVTRIFISPIIIFSLLSIIVDYYYYYYFIITRLL